MSSIVAQIDAGLSYVASLVDRPEIDYEALVVYSSWAVTAFDLYIQMYDLKQPPQELKEDLTPELFDKAQKYGKDKTRYSVIKTLVDQLISVFMIRSGIYHKAWAQAAELLDAFGFTQDYTIVKSLVWVTILVGISLITSIPFSWYYTFVLEERHGFNKQTTKLWIMDQIKTYILMAVIGLPFLAGFLKIVEKAGRGFVPWLMLFVVAFQLLLQIIYPTFIQPLFNKLTPLPAGDLRTRTEKLASQLDFPLKHLYQIDGSKRSSHSNAYFYGLPWSKHIVIYDTLMEKSKPSEVEAVLGHELGHWYFSHPSKLLLVAQSHLFFTLTVFSIFIHNASLYKSFGFDSRLATHNPAGGAQPIIIGFMLFQFVLTPLDTVVKFGMNSITRAYEYQADEFAVELDKREELKNALIKLHRDNLSSPHNDPLYSAYNHSHPTLPERIRAIDAYVPKRNLKLKGEGKKEL